MLLNMSALLKQQGIMLTNFNKMLGCHRPDAAKVKYDAEKAVKAAKDD